LCALHITKGFLQPPDYVAVYSVLSTIARPDNLVSGMLRYYIHGYSPYLTIFRLGFHVVVLDFCVVRTGFEPVLGETFATAHSDANFT
jgi:hypothetical protein